MNRGEARDLRSASIRLAAQFAGLVLVLVVLLGVVVYSIVAAGQSESAKQTVIAASAIDSPRDAPPAVLVTIVGHDGVQQSPDLPAGLPDQAAITRVGASGQAEQSTRTLDGRTYLVRTSSDHGRVTQVAYDLFEQQEELSRLLTALIVSGLIAVVAAAGIGIVIARRAMRPLADALALQRRFVADASHELRTPLTLLSTRAQLVRRQLREDKGPGGVSKFAEGIDEIVDDSKALSEIVEDLLAAADPRMDDAREAVDLVAATSVAAKSIEPKAAERGVAVRLEGAAELVVTGAEMSLRRMVFALLDNAIEHARSSIVVTVEQAGRLAVIRVEDDGPGFPVESLGRAFERFASVRDSPVPDSGPAADEGGDGSKDGSRHYGLGLALVAEVATRHRGTVEAGNSNALGGASLTVRLPVRRDG